jgi:threonine dehydratase
MEFPRAAIAEVERLIRPHVRRTPVLQARAEEFGLAPGELSFKLELLQHSGSFKARGAFANLLTRQVLRESSCRRWLRRRRSR